MPLRRGLSLLRAEPEVRKPERAAAQAGRAGVDGPDAGMSQISVIGSGSCAQDSDIAELAERVGRGLAEAGAVLVCGGLGGVMEAASSGAARAGGVVIGIVP